MIQREQSFGNYSLLPSCDDYVEPKANSTSNRVTSAHQERSSLLTRLAFTTVVAFCLLASFVGGIFAHRTLQLFHSSILEKQDSEQYNRSLQSPLSLPSSLSPSSPCRNPTIRREWRALSQLEKLEYIAAVQCLRNSPSSLGYNQTLYDDFPWVHNLAARHIHGTAAFLAWHRYYLSIYEESLQRKCNYTGNLPYWDWALDWEDFTASPIWHSKAGFGGNGNTSDVESVNESHCVTDGPFAHLTVANFGLANLPHCLGRRFEANETVKQQAAQGIRPVAVEKLLRESKYESFNIETEYATHDSIPHLVGGDFATFSAPNDPVFFLHHTQIDRVWWKWQQMDPQRLTDYAGEAGGESNDDNNATLTDTLFMADLAPDLQVMDIINTEAGRLCYRY